MATEPSTPEKKWKYDIYFPHKAGARNDPKLVKVFIKFGYHGLGIFWSLMEILREQPEYKYPAGDLEALAHSLRLDTADLQTVMQTFLDVDLIKKQDGFLFSSGLLDNMDRVRKKSEKARASARARWEKAKGKTSDRSASAMRSHNERNPNAMQVKKSKVNPNQKGLSLPFLSYVSTPTAKAAAHALEGLGSAWPYQSTEEKKIAEDLLPKVLAEWAEEIKNELSGSTEENIAWVKEMYPGGIVEFLTEKIEQKPNFHD